MRLVGLWSNAGPTKSAGTLGFDSPAWLDFAGASAASLRLGEHFQHASAGTWASPRVASRARLNGRMGPKSQHAHRGPCAKTRIDAWMCAGRNRAGREKRRALALMVRVK